MESYNSSLSCVANDFYVFMLLTDGLSGHLLFARYPPPLITWHHLNKKYRSGMDHINKKYVMVIFIPISVFIPATCIYFMHFAIDFDHVDLWCTILFLRSFFVNLYHPLVERC